MEEYDRSSLCFGGASPLTEIGDDSDGEKLRKKPRNRTPEQHLKGFLKVTDKKIQESQLEEHIVRFKSFSYAHAVRNSTGANDQTCEDVETVWDDGACRTAVDVEGIPIVVSLPMFLAKKKVSDLNESVASLTNIVPLKCGQGADKNGRDDPSSYKKVDGELTGCLKLSHMWHAIGHSNKSGNISSDFLSKGKVSGFGATQKFIKDLSMLSERVNHVFSKIDGPFYERLKKLRAFLVEKYPYVEGLSAIDPLLMEGRSLICNRITKLHLDSSDPKGAWEFIVALGTFTEGGYLCIPRLRLKIRFLPGDVIILRGSILAHKIEIWVGGQRISLVHFTHRTVWDEAELTMPSAEEYKQTGFFS